MGQSFSLCCTCEQSSSLVKPHCLSWADTEKKPRNMDGVVHSVRKHKKCLLKGKILKGAGTNFSENLARILDVPDELITDHYEFGKVIGIGQYGTVKEAYSLECSGEKVAVKILDLEGLSKSFKSIWCEVSSLKQANHQNIIKLHRWYKDEHKLYLVFEYIDGMDLSDYITENIRISEEKARIILLQICKTINYLNSIHICHRDIKLDNIMINPDTLEVKLIDFGFATKFNERVRLNGKIGTPYYVAPEVLEGTYGKECDMWSIGIMSYFMLVGDPPFNAQSDDELYDHIINNPVHYKEQDWAGISKECIDFIKSLLIKDPAYRLTAEESLAHPWLAPKLIWEASENETRSTA